MSTWPHEQTNSVGKVEGAPRKGDDVAGVGLAQLLILTACLLSILLQGGSVTSARHASLSTWC